MQNTRRWVPATALPLAMAVALAACAGDQGPVAARAPRTAAASAQPQTPVAELTRGVALALGDQGLRERIRNDMRHAPYHEHKLELSSYLHGANGGILLAAMARASGHTREDVLSMLANAPRLEFYMPVPAQREAWKATADVLVAYQLDEHVPPVAYDVSGRATQLSLAGPPVQPVLALVPVETDFAHPLPAKALKNVRDQGGATIGTYSVDTGTCADNLDNCPVDDGSGVGVTYPPGVYMTYSHLEELGESWLKGSPEIEVFVLGQPPAENEAREVTCAGEHSADFRQFDQNDHDWSGRVLLLNQDVAQQFHFTGSAADPHAFSIVVFEDDDSSCEIVTDKNLRLLALNSTILGAGAFFYLRDSVAEGRCQGSVSGPWCLFVAGFGWYEAARGFASLIKTNDDYLGMAVDRGTVANAGYPGNSHILFMNEDGSSRNGAINLIYYP